jgi:carbonic anhydrase
MSVHTQKKWVQTSGNLLSFPDPRPIIFTILKSHADLRRFNSGRILLLSGEHSDKRNPKCRRKKLDSHAVPKQEIMNLKDVFENNKKWVSSKLEVDQNYFENLSKGQKPELLYIGCSDSRVTAEDLMGAQPGEAFVHRNVANMAISIDLNFLTVLKYAVDHLNVNHVVVCGHYGCGGIKAAMEPSDLGALNPWLRNIRDVYRIHKEELKSIEDEGKKYDRLVELNVEDQCIKIIKTATEQKAHKERNLQVHGWVFDIRSGELIDLKIDFDQKLQNIMEIYDVRG